MLDSRQLDTLSQLNIETVDKNDLVDIRDVTIDKNLPAPLRMLQYLEKIKNPYCFTCGGIPVKVSFSSDGSELEALLKRHFIALKR